MAADHALDSAADSPTPIEFLFMGVDRPKSASRRAAIIAHPRIPIQANAAARCIKQPLIPSEANTAPERSVEVAVAMTLDLRAFASLKGTGAGCRVGFEAAAVRVHVAEVDLRP